MNNYISFLMALTLVCGCSGSRPPDEPDPDLVAQGCAPVMVKPPGMATQLAMGKQVACVLYEA